MFQNFMSFTLMLSMILTITIVVLACVKDGSLSIKSIIEEDDDDEEDIYTDTDK